MGKGRIQRTASLIFAAGLLFGLAACGGSGNASTSASPTEQPPAALVTTTAIASASPAGSPAARGTAAGGANRGSLLGLSTPTPSGPSASATPLSSQALDGMSLTATDLPSGFAITGSGPGGPELGRDVLASYQEEFQQRDVTSTQSLQQTIIVIALLGQYKDAASALSGIKAVSAENLNQLLGSVNLSAEATTIPTIADDSTAFHFSGDTNGTSIGGYMVLFHHGPIATLILTASVKGSESLPQTIDLAQKQAQKLQSS